MSLKSKHAPQTKRLTVTPSLAFLISGRSSSTTFAIASKDSDVDLSPSYLHRHSRQTRLKLMAPFAKGTSANAVLERTFWMAGAKAYHFERSLREDCHTVEHSDRKADEDSLTLQ